MRGQPGRAEKQNDAEEQLRPHGGSAVQGRFERGHGNRCPNKDVHGGKSHRHNEYGGDNRSKDLFHTTGLRLRYCQPKNSANEQSVVTFGGPFEPSQDKLRFLARAGAREITTTATGAASPRSPSYRANVDASGGAQSSAPYTFGRHATALVLTHPIDSKTMRRGDTIFAETTAPVLAEDLVVIPSGAFVQGKVGKNTLVGSGVGTAIGAAAHTTQTTTFAGMTMTSETPKGVAIGGITGLAAGTIVSFVLMARSRHFYVGEGSPLEMTLPRTVTVPSGKTAESPPWTDQR